MDSEMTKLPETAHIQHVHLQVANLARSLAFYRDAMGFQVVRQNETEAQLSATGQDPIKLILSEVPDAIEKPAHTTGLYHVAILLPSRLELARLFRRLIEQRIPFGGFSDHHVSEALYLPDPDGNGLELYRDRPRSEWRWNGDEVYMATEPLDLDDLLAETERNPSEWQGIHPDTTIGHVHLHVGNLAEAEAFYRDVIGLDVMLSWARYRAAFLSAGQYHHHLGINTWAGEGAPPAPANAVGLRSYALAVGDGLAEAIQRLEKAGVTIERDVDYGYAKGVKVHDPAGNVVELVNAG